MAADLGAAPSQCVPAHPDRQGDRSALRLVRDARSALLRHRGPYAARSRFG